MEIATFGAGCFWGPEVTFGEIEGVQETSVGYMGGNTDNPTYKDVCSGTTNHAEVVQITYDPNEVSFEYLLSVFWDCHDPTQINRQGPDFGTQYRSVIFCHTQEQQTMAEESRDALHASGYFHSPIATSIEQAPKYWLAEDYHQKYMEKRRAAVGYR
ncbi:MAG: peptide-methionine (S)-S-oxide reductase MsrA [Rhodospirillales bacterium]|jgi:peptide-methionine (S)-S-oxide reductase|nr:peptide-methionine (S)-S-oxide reductase MsrA [Rhodospirillales bacterium]